MLGVNVMINAATFWSPIAAIVIILIFKDNLRQIQNWFVKYSEDQFTN